MPTYSNEYSQFPDQLISMREFKDVTSDIDAIIQQVKTHKKNGDYAAAAQVLRNNPSLASYMFSATDINTLVEEIYNAQIAALNAAPYSGSSGSTSASGFVTGNTPPTVAAVGTVWISGASV